MKTFKIKTSDFVNLKTVDKITDANTQSQVSQVEATTGDSVVKNLNKGKSSVLMIGASGKYYITARPCYVESLVAILKSVGIDASDIVYVRNANNTQTDIPLDRLRAMLTA